MLWPTCCLRRHTVGLNSLFMAFGHLVWLRAIIDFGIYFDRAWRFFAARSHYSPETSNYTYVALSAFDLFAIFTRRKWALLLQGATSVQMSTTVRVVIIYGSNISQYISHLEYIADSSIRESWCHLPTPSKKSFLLESNLDSFASIWSSPKDLIDSHLSVRAYALILH